MHQQRTIIKNSKVLDWHYKTIENAVRISKHNSDRHELAKYLVSRELIQNGHIIITEAIFENGCRADIYSLTDGKAIEIIETETEKSMLSKMNKYPVPITFLEFKKVINSSWVSICKN